MNALKYNQIDDSYFIWKKKHGCDGTPKHWHWIPPLDSNQFQGKIQT